MTSPPAILAALLLCCLLLAIAWRDLAVRRIPNGFCLAVAGCGLWLRGADGLAALGVSLAAASLLFALLFALFAFGLLGGGDVKLAAAVAVGLPPLSAWHFVILTALAGGVLAALYLAAIRLAVLGRPARCAPPRGRAHGVLRRVAAAERRRLRRGGPLPYGIAICASALVMVATGHAQG